MVINPTTTIKLFAGVPLDNTYNNTLYFANQAAQLAYFNSLTPVKTFNQQMYQRVNAGVFEARCKADDIYNVNYMAFQNAGFGTKWFYAFVKSVEYVNNNNARVTFEIDVMQTYFFDITREQCYVERCHSVTDNIGDNILPEPVAVGEYVFQNYINLFKNSLSEWLIAIEICDVSGDEVDGKIYDGVYCGATVIVFPTTAGGIASANEFLGAFTQKPESVLMVYMLPRLALNISGTISDDGVRLGSTSAGNSAVRVCDAITGLETFQGYQPKNKKLYTYPYNYYHVDNGDGSAMPTRYEFFTNLTPTFEIQLNIVPPVQLKLMPRNYKGAVASETGNAYLSAEFLSLGNLPIGGWNYDTYKAWQAQNALPLALKAAAGVAGLVVGAFTGGAGLALGAVSLAGMTASVISEDYQASIQADTCKGNYSCGNVAFSHGESSFFGGRCHITRDYAIMIDKYFDRFGYKQGRLMLPPQAVRPHWTYVKTIGCEVKGNCPADDIKKICSIYDAGITFWRNASEIGNYSLDNSPV